MSRVLGDARRVLTADVDLALPDRELVAEATARDTSGFDGALLGIDAITVPRARVAEVASRLGAGAALLMVAPLRPGMGERARGLLTRTPPPRVSLPAVCEALLLAGLCGPRVYDDVPELLLVSARAPMRRTALDAFFPQPAR